MAYAAKRSGLEGRVPTPYLLVSRRQSLSERAFIAQRSHKTVKPHLSALGALPQAAQPARKLQAERETEVRKLVSQGCCTRNLAGPCKLSRIAQGPCEASGNPLFGLHIPCTLSRWPRFRGSHSKSRAAGVRNEQETAAGVRNEQPIATIVHYEGANCGSRAKRAATAQQPYEKSIDRNARAK